MKKLCALLLSVSTLMGLTACGNSNGGGSDEKVSLNVIHT